MANIGKWNAPGSVFTVLAATLNSLANATISGAGPVMSNNNNLDIYSDWWLHLGALTPSAGGYCTTYILEALDGVTFPAATAALRNQTSQILCTFGVDTGNVAQDIVVRQVVLPPVAFQVVVDNQMGTAMTSTGNTLKVITYNINLNG